MTILLLAGAAVLLAFAGVSGLTAAAVGFDPEQPGRRGDIARRVAGTRLTGPRPNAASLWWNTGEFALLSIGSLLGGLSSMARYADVGWLSGAAVVFFALGVAAGVVELIRRRAGARRRTPTH